MSQAVNHHLITGTQPDQLALELSARWTPLLVLQQLNGTSGLLGLISSRPDLPTGRYSYVMTTPVQRWTIREVQHGDSPFAQLKQHSASSQQSQPIAELPPFQGGYAGLLGYELNHAFEKLPRADTPCATPALAVGEYRWVIAWDHQQNKCWLIISQTPHPQQKLTELLTAYPWLTENPNKTVPPCKTVAHAQALHTTSTEHFEPSSNFTGHEFAQAVEAVREFIAAGDLFQANLSHQLSFPRVSEPLDLLTALCHHNPAPMSGYFQWDEMTVISASPERFLQVHNSVVTTCPIKGTRRRTGYPEADMFQAEELRISEKDRAENVMIVDLLRNDLSRVCQPGSIRVPALCRLETFATVQHLVSEIQGRLKPGHDWWDLIAACWPGGSITGAPKIRAMEIITQLEQTERGPYCGSLFYLGYNGNADSSILIRTFVQTASHLTCNVGGGITWRSNSEAEYLETLDKAAGMIKSYQSIGK